MRRAPGREHLVEDRAHRVDVGAFVGPLAARFLGRVVVEQSRVGRGRPGAGRLEPAPRRQLEGGHLGVPFRGDHNRVRTETAVDVAGCVGGGHRVGDLRRQLQRPANLQRTACHLHAQGLPLEKLEHEIDAPAVLAGVEERGDVGVRQREGGARLLKQAGTRPRVGCELGGQPADRDRAAQPGVTGPVQVSGTIRLEPLEQIVVSDGPNLTWRRGHVSQVWTGRAARRRASLSAARSRSAPVPWRLQSAR